MHAKYVNISFLNSDSSIQQNFTSSNIEIFILLMIQVILKKFNLQHNSIFFHSACLMVQPRDVKLLKSRQKNLEYCLKIGDIMKLIIMYRDTKFFHQKAIRSYCAPIPHLILFCSIFIIWICHFYFLKMSMALFLKCGNIQRNRFQFSELPIPQAICSEF